MGEEKQGHEFFLNHKADLSLYLKRPIHHSIWELWTVEKKIHSTCFEAGRVMSALTLSGRTHLFKSILFWLDGAQEEMVCLQLESNETNLMYWFSYTGAKKLCVDQILEELMRWDFTDGSCFDTTLIKILILGQAKQKGKGPPPGTLVTNPPAEHRKSLCADSQVRMETIITSPRTGSQLLIHSSASNHLVWGEALINTKC